MLQTPAALGARGCAPGSILCQVPFNSSQAMAERRGADAISMFLAKSTQQSSRDENFNQLNWMTSTHRPQVRRPWERCSVHAYAFLRLHKPHSVHGPASSNANKARKSNADLATRSARLGAARRAVQQHAEPWLCLWKTQWRHALLVPAFLQATHCARRCERLLSAGFSCASTTWRRLCDIAGPHTIWQAPTAVTDLCNMHHNAIWMYVELIWTYVQLRRKGLPLASEEGGRGSG